MRLLGLGGGHACGPCVRAPWPQQLCAYALPVHPISLKVLMELPTFVCQTLMMFGGLLITGKDVKTILSVCLLGIVGMAPYLKLANSADADRRMANAKQVLSLCFPFLISGSKP